jgi:hypothetical protein
MGEWSEKVFRFDDNLKREKGVQKDFPMEIFTPERGEKVFLFRITLHFFNDLEKKSGGNSSNILERDHPRSFSIIKLRCGD